MAAPSETIGDINSLFISSIIPQFVYNTSSRFYNQKSKLANDNLDELTKEPFCIQHSGSFELISKLREHSPILLPILIVSAINFYNAFYKNNTAVLKLSVYQFKILLIWLGILPEVP